MFNYKMFPSNSRYKLSWVTLNSAKNMICPSVPYPYFNKSKYDKNHLSEQRVNNMNNNSYLWRADCLHQNQGLKLHYFEFFALFSHHLEKVSILIPILKMKKQVSGRAEIWTQVILTSKPVFHLPNTAQGKLRK